MNDDQFLEFLKAKTTDILETVEEGYDAVQDAKTTGEAGDAYADMLEAVERIDRHVLANTLVQLMLPYEKEG